MAMQEQAVCSADNLFAASQMMPIDADSLTIAASQNLKRGSLVNSSGVLIGAGTAAVKASGTLTYSTNPSASDTITVGTTTLTYVASDPTSSQILIGDTLADTLANTVARLPASVVGSVSSGVLTITAAVGGTAGNSIALAESSSAISASGANLSGGTDAVIDLDVYAVLAEDCDTSGGVAKVAPVFLTGDFNARALIVSATAGATVADCKVNARKVGIFIKDTVAI